MHTKLYPFLALAFGAFCIGFSPIFVKLSEVGAITTAFYRVFLAIPILCFVSFSKLPALSKKQKISNKKIFFVVIVASLFFSGDLIFWHISIQYTTVANSTLFANLAVVFVALGGWVLFSQKIQILFVIGMIISLFGAILLGAHSVQLGTDYIIGDILAILTAFCYAGYLLSVSWIRAVLGTRTIMVLTSIICAIIILPFALLFEDSFFPHTYFGWGVIFLLAWFSHALGQGCIAFGLGYVTPALSAITLLIQPLVAAAIAWVIFEENLGVLQCVGAIAIMVGIVWCRYYNTQ